jgi:hypothetical protein
MPLAFAAALALALVAAGPASASVLLIGDSLALGGESTLKQIVPGIQIDAEGGRPSSVGVAALARDFNGQQVVAFDLGTNDDPTEPQAFLADLQRAREIVGDSCLIVATINRPPLNGVSYDAINRAIESLAFRDGNTQIVPWKLAAKLHPEALVADGIHGTAYGYQLRAHLFATAIRECPGGGSAVSEPERRSAPPAPSPADHANRAPAQPAPPKPTAAKPTGPDIWAADPAASLAGWIVDEVQGVVAAAERVGN